MGRRERAAPPLLPTRLAMDAPIEHLVRRGGLSVAETGRVMSCCLCLLASGATEKKKKGVLV